MRVLELPDRLRAYGVEPVELDGWTTRGKEFPARPDGALRHWTAGSTKGATPSLRVVTHGRSDLPGPLCHVLQSREPSGRDKAYVVASGIANHAGRGDWNGIQGNSRLLGLEIEWSGPNEAFSADRIDVSERIMRALLDCCTGANTDDVAEHREYALPKGRKPDTNLDGDVLRRRMQELLIPDPLPEDDVALELFYIEDPDAMPPSMRDGTLWYLTDGKEFWWCPSPEHAAALVDSGLLKTAAPTARPAWFIKSLRPRSRFDMEPRNGYGSGGFAFFKQDGTIHPHAFD